MTAPRRAAAHPTLLAVIIGGLVLAGVIALFTVLGGANSSSGATDNRAAGKKAAPSSSAPVSSSAPAKAPAKAPATASASATAPKATKPAAKKQPATVSLPATARRSITYVVKHGDNLTVIAAWFHQHGYGNVYEQNRQVIGKNPNLIFPGEKITIANGRMSLSG